MTITIREPGSAITHFIGMMLALIASAPLLAKAALDAGRTGIFSMAVFMTSMILLYGASALYHSVNLSGNRLKVFRKIDHMMIFVLIAGSYTPVCLLVLEPQSGYILLITVWAIAAARNPRQSTLDHMSKMVFFYIIYCSWMGMSFCFRTAHRYTFQTGIFLAALSGASCIRQAASSTP